MHKFIILGLKIVNFINIKRHKVKKITINIFIPVLLGAIMLIGNTISISGYNLSIPKSFAKESRITSNFNPNPQQTSSLHHHSAVHTAAGQSNFNPNPQQTSSLHHHSAVHTAAGQSNFNSNPQQTSSLHHHSAVHTAAGQSNFNPNSQQTSNIHSTGQSVFTFRSLLQWLFHLVELVE